LTAENEVNHCHPVTLSPCHPVILIGYRGTGKTTVARLLAERLGWNWLDADAVLEARYGKTIRQIFADEGETRFRNMEATVLEELCRCREHVIATGGGVVLRTENRARLRSAGLVVWLTGDPATLWQRISEDAATRERRPDLSIGGQREVELLLQIREPFYQEVAELSISTVGRSPAEVVEAILSGVRSQESV